VFLQICGATEMIFVAMRRDHNFDVCGIKAKSFQAGQQNRLHIFRVAGIENHNSGGGREDIGDGVAHRVRARNSPEIVENLYGAGIGSLRGVRVFAEEMFGLGPVCPGDLFCSIDMFLNFGGRRFGGGALLRLLRTNGKDEEHENRQEWQNQKSMFAHCFLRSEGPEIPPIIFLL